jgi:hypothetical protein
MKENMIKHVRTVSIILMLLGTIYLLAAGFFGIFGFVAAQKQTDPADLAVLPTLLTGGTILFPLVLLGGLHIIIAKAFIGGKGWARIGMWILAILNLGNVPLGTGLGIYAIWVLINTREEALKIQD